MVGSNPGALIQIFGLESAAALDMVARRQGVTTEDLLRNAGGSLADYPSR
ncbi:hypothetical protein H4W26_001047 [Nesterenkonia halotolerans]|uniref:Uncharacterized protein n=1 Tax=Nesterenkonia halotolerans TaxID=225325 RepID=A0ABR9J5L8_9MICC|nr:hypothetical protein [Nesterenkonia halotolerans]